MALPVVATASIMCPFSPARGTLVVVPAGPPVMMENKPAATIMDFKPFVNIMPFGPCMSLSNPITASLTAAALGVLTPGPCTPVTMPWKPGSSTVMYGNFPALNNTSTCQCAFGGVITTTFGGATTEQIP